MKEVTYYECEVCNTAYTTREAALSCESQPAPEIPAFLQIGVEYSYYHDWEIVTSKLVDIIIKRHGLYCKFENGRTKPWYDVFPMND